MPLEKLPYCAEMVHGHDRVLFWWALFAPPHARNGLMAIFALDVELCHLRRMVTEEMIGHIRYAWWRETLEGLIAGVPGPGHPIIEALGELRDAGHLPGQEVLALVEHYATAYPQEAEGSAQVLQQVADRYLALAAPGLSAPFEYAGKYVVRHRQLHGQSKRIALLLRLWLLSFQKQR